MPRTIPKAFLKTRKKPLAIMLVSWLFFVCFIIVSGGKVFKPWYNCCIDNEGLVYVAASDGVLVFDGITLSKRITIPEQKSAYYVIMNARDELLLLTSDNQSFLYDKNNCIIVATDVGSIQSTTKNACVSSNGKYSAVMRSALGYAWIEKRDEMGERSLIRFPIRDYLMLLGTFLSGIVFAVLAIKTLIDARVLYGEQIQRIKLRIARNPHD